MYYQLRTPKARFSAERRFICNRGQPAGNQRQTQKMENECKEEGNKGKGTEISVEKRWGSGKGLPLEREETVVRRRKMVV